MMLYKHISTQKELSEFVKKLNEITHYERYLLFAHVFETTTVNRSESVLSNEDKHIYLEMWSMKIGDFIVYITTRINTRNFIDNPEIKTGAIENIYFHLTPDDPGISQFKT